MNPYDYAMKLISIHPDLEKAWKLKDEIAGFYCSCTLKNAPEEIERIIQDFLHSEIDELVKFGYTMINWKNEIVHSFIVSRAEYSISKKTGKAAVESKRINQQCENRKGEQYHKNDDKIGKWLYQLGTF